MGTMKVSNFYMGRLTNAFHASFHHVIVTQLEEVGDSSIGLPTGFNNQYKAAVQTEQDIVNRTLGSAKTDELNAQDDLRDKYFRAVRNVLKNVKNSSNENISSLYDVIYKKLIKPYPGTILKESDHTESSHLRGFIFDVKQYLTTSQIASLGITADLEALQTANEAFEAAYLERVDEYVKNPAGYGEKCREEVDKYWAQLVRTLNFYANETGNSDNTIKMIAEEAADYMANLNKHISEFLKSVAASGTRGESENSGSNGNTGSQDNGNSGSSTEKPSTNTGGNSGTSGGSGNTNTGGNSGTSGGSSNTGGNSGTSGGYNNDL